MVTRTLAMMLAFGLAGPAALVQAPPHPQVIELYQSQGCSSCPPANAVLNGLTDRKDLLTLSFSVTYWDHLGWKDGFAKPAFTQRQYDYAATARRSGVQTPQMVINGRGFITGVTAAEVADAVRRYARRGREPVISLSHGTISVGDGTGRGTVWLVRYDPATLQVPISAGENSGRTLPHRHIVRELIRLGEWNGKAISLGLPKGKAGLSSAILVQSGKGGAIVAAAGI